MSFAMAFDGTVAGGFLLASLILLSVKLIATLVQLRLMRGNYRETPNTAFFKAVYLTGKATPALAVGCAFVSAMLKHNQFHSWFFGCLALFSALLAFYVVRLRQQGKFFGVLELLSSKRR